MTTEKEAVEKLSKKRDEILSNGDMSSTIIPGDRCVFIRCFVGDEFKNFTEAFSSPMPDFEAGTVGYGDGVLLKYNPGFICYEVFTPLEIYAELELYKKALENSCVQFDLNSKECPVKKCVLWRDYGCNSDNFKNCFLDQAKKKLEQK